MAQVGLTSVHPCLAQHLHLTDGLGDESRLGLRLLLRPLLGRRRLRRRALLAGGSFRTSARFEAGRVCMTYLQGECSYRRAKEREQI